MRISTSGESHGKGLFAIIEGVPAHLKLDLEQINFELSRRQSGYGRGGRQKIERDEVEILSGVRNLETIGSPVTLAVWNRDYENWKAYMAPEGCKVDERMVTEVRPGHADLTGMKKFAHEDARNVLERASARETAIRVAVGAVCKTLLSELGVEITGYVKSVNTVVDQNEYSFEEIKGKRDTELGMMSEELTEKAKARIDEIKASGDTCGGTLEVRVKGLKSGFGSYATYGEKLDARLTAGLMSIQAVKGVAVGEGFRYGELTGSTAHDEMYPSCGGVLRKTNRAGGIEGGMSNGEEIKLNLVMKPIPTLMQGLDTVDTKTGEAVKASKERSDVCAVTACEVIAETVVATELAKVVLERLGGDTMPEVKARYEVLPV